MLPEAESSRKVSERKLSQKNQPRSPPDLRLLASAEDLMSILQPLYMTLICILIFWLKIWLMTNKGLMSWDKIWPGFRTRWQRCIYCRLKKIGFNFLLRCILLRSLMVLMANCSFISSPAATWSMYFMDENPALLILEPGGILVRKANTQTAFYSSSLVTCLQWLLSVPVTYV